MERKTRSTDKLFTLRDADFKRRDFLDLGKVQQLPDYKYIIERCLTIRDDLPDTKAKKEDIILNTLTHEVRYIWIFMNIPCLKYPTIRSKIKSVYSTVLYLKSVKADKRKVKWNDDVTNILSKLNNGFDVRNYSLEGIKEMEDVYGVKMTKEDEDFHADNCLLKDENGQELEKCRRLRWSAHEDSAWLKKMLRRKERIEKQKEFKEIAQERMEIDQSIAEWSEDEDEFQGTSNPHETETIFDDYTPTNLKKSEIHIEHSFPQIPVRTGYRTVDVNIMECLVVLESVFKVEQRKCTKLLAYVANKVFGQNWKVESDEVETCDEEEEETRDEEEEETSEEPKVKRKKIGDLKYVLTCTKSNRRWVEQFSLLSLADVAQQIVEAHDEGDSVNYGVDDTAKAAGNKKFDLKGAHITITGTESRQRESFSTGFNVNASHCGKESAKTIQYDIAKLAVLCGNSYESMIEMIDFFMTDRAGENDIMLNELGIEERKKLKCNAHVVLCVDAAIEKVLKETEEKMGKRKLISEGASHVFSSRGSSILRLGLIAIAKLVSPSHMKESISLYKSYTDFLKENIKSSNEYAAISSKLQKDGFKGFVSNRFGRIGELSEAVIQHKDLLRVFFDQQVNVHDNKLVLAVDAYLRSNWFFLCCSLSSIFYEKVILPIKKILGIDEFKKLRVDRSWTSIKCEFNEILSVLEKMKQIESSSGFELLKSKCAEEVHVAIDRQLSRMNFFSKEIVENDKLEGAVITNLGCEAEFACLDNDLRRTGGAVSIETISNRHIIARNKLFSKDRWEQLSKLEKKEKWCWAKNSQEAKKVKEMEREFKERLEGLNKLSIQSKIEKKKREDKKLMETLDKCKKHGGPVTLNDIDKLDKLDDEQVKAEASYYKKISGGSAIRFKHKVGNKFISFSTEELRKQIRDILKPSTDTNENIDEMIQCTFSTVQPTPTPSIDIPSNETNEIGMIGWWKGLLGQRKVGVVVSTESLQIFSIKRYGLIPEIVLQPKNEWVVEEEIESYHYEEVGGRVVLILDD